MKETNELLGIYLSEVGKKNDYLREHYTILDGFPGVMLALAQFYILENNNEIKNKIELLACNYLNDLNNYEIHISSSTSGLLTGPLGISAVIDIWAQIGEEKIFWNKLNKRFYKSIEFLLDFWSTTNINDLQSKFKGDWIFGFPGVLTYICNCKIAHQNEMKYWRFKKAVQNICKNDLFKFKVYDNFSLKNLGMAHGTSGIILSILEYELSFLNNIDITNNTYLWYKDVSKSIINCIDRYTNDSYDFYDFLPNSGNRLQTSWCNGLCGLLPLASIMEDKKILYKIAEFLNKITPSSINSIDEGIYCICHGFGSIEYAKYYLNNSHLDMSLFKFKNYCILPDINKTKENDIGFLSGLGGFLALNASIIKKQRCCFDWMLGMNDFF